MKNYFDKKHLKNKKIIMFIILFIVISLFNVLNQNTVFAESKINVSINKDSVEKNDVVEITVDTVNLGISAFTLQIYFDNTKLQYLNETENSNFVENRVIYTWIDENLKERSSVKTEKFKFKAIGDGTAIIVVTGEFYDKNGNSINLQDGEIQINIGKKETLIVTEDTEDSVDEGNTSKDNAFLRILRLDKEGISPDFQKDVLEYYFIADNSVNQLQITAIPENENAQVTVTGNTKLKQGLNTIKIQVQSEDKSKKMEYKIHVTKTQNKELANANLENLAIKEGMLYPSFDANITKYNIDIANDITDLTILAIPEKINANTTITGGKNLRIGDNTITVNVTAENGVTTKKYVITAYRRNESEEAQAKEEQQNNIQQLEAILENGQEEEDNNDGENEKIQEEISLQDKITFVLLGVVVVGFVVAYVMKKEEKKHKM